MATHDKEFSSALPTFEDLTACTCLAKTHSYFFPLAIPHACLSLTSAMPLPLVP